MARTRRDRSAGSITVPGVAAGDRPALRRWAWVLLGVGILLVAVDVVGYFLGYFVAFVAPVPIVGGVIVAVLARTAAVRAAAAGAAALSLLAGAVSCWYLLAPWISVG